jgi:hypothetical protein
VPIFLKHIEKGLPIRVAAVLAGLHYDTVMSWLSAARDGDTRYADFIDRYTRARSVAQNKSIERIRRIGAEDWRAEAWLAERMFPKDFNLKQQMELSGKDGGPVAIDAGVSVIIESSNPTGGASRLTPFADEREGSPWHGRSGLSPIATATFSIKAVSCLACSRNCPRNAQQPRSTLIQHRSLHRQG